MRSIICCLSLLLLILFFSCIPQKKLLYLQDKTNEPDYVNPYQPATNADVNYRIQPGDYLYIRILTANNDLAAFYSLSLGTSSSYQMSSMGNEGMKYISYQVNEQGYLEMPNIEKMEVKGLTLEEIKSKITSVLLKQIDQFTVVVQLTNVYFTIIGEGVAGNYPMRKDVLNVYQALAMAGGLKTFSKLKAVRIIHAKPNGKSEITTVDLTDKNLLDSQQSLIYPNDIIYVEPIKAKTWGIGETFSLGMFTSLITLYLLIKSL